jgi:hypothetical protein
MICRHFKKEVMELSILINELNERRMVLEEIIAKTEAELVTAPTGKLRITGRHEDPQFYLRENPKDKGGKYIRREDRPVAAALAQKTYNAAVIKSAVSELGAIDNLLGVWQKGTVEDEFGKLSIPRKQLVTPIILPDEAFTKQWLEIPYEPKGFNENDPEYYSTAGTRVRSKSEIILADIFDSYPVPRKFECPVKLWNGKIIHPDFTLLNVRERKEYIWEHFGRADDPGYMRYNVTRINALIRSGWFPGVNFIMTFETSETPLDSKIVHALIEQFLL